MSGERLLRVTHHALIVLLVVSSMVALSAQAVVDPRYVEFNASSDHNTQASDGTPIVSRYSLSIHELGSAASFATVDLGKPTPNASGVIRVDFLALLSVVPTPGVTFEARVTAVGPGGSAGSTLSNQFSFALPACSPTISPGSASVGQGAGTGSVSVTAGASCAWSAETSASWIALTGATGGSGNGSVPYSVSANTQTSPRVGTLSIAGQTFTVTQAAMGCSYALSPTSRSIVAAGGSNTTSVTAATGCSWTASSNAPAWLTVTGGASGNGSGVVTFSAAANASTQARTGTLTIGGQTFTANQAGMSCTFSLSPTSRSVTAAGGSNTTSVTAPAGCAWTATSNASTWLTVTGGASGNGSGVVTFNAATNATTQPRSGTLTIGGQTFTANQAAGACSFSISPSTLTASAAGASGSTTVTTTSACSWTAASNASWVTVTAGAARTGSGIVNFAVAANTGTQRTGTLTIAGRTFTVTQNANQCSYAISPASRTIAGAGGSSSTFVTTTSSCGWQGTSSVPWITVSSSSSGGSGSLTYTVAANPGSARVGTITVGTQVHTVNQNASTPPVAPGGLRIVSIAGGQ